MLRRIKWIVIFVFLFYLVVFITANNQSLTIYYFWDKPLFGYKPVPMKIIKAAKEEGKPVPEPTEPRQVPVILVILASFICGVVVTSIFGTMERFKFSSKIRQEKKMIKMEKKKLKLEEKEKTKLEKQKMKEQKRADKEGRNKNKGVIKGDTKEPSEPSSGLRK